MKTTALLALALLALAHAAPTTSPHATPGAHSRGMNFAKPKDPNGWAHKYVMTGKGDWNVVPNPQSEAAWRNHLEKNVKSQPTATWHELKTTESGKVVAANAGFHVQDADDHVDARAYRDLLARNAYITHQLQALYATALWNNCNTYLNALRANNLTLLDQLISGVVAPGAQGRIHPLGYFDSSEGLVEYFMLACFPAPTVTQVVKETWTEITAYRDIVHFNIDFCFQIPPYNPHLPCNNLTHVGWARFDQQGRVKAIKILFQRLGINDLVIPPLSNLQQQAVVTATQTGTIQQLCGAIQLLCVGPNLQYNTTQDCVNYLSSINYGNLERADQRDIGCVSIHTTLCQSRPQIHCFHVGPNGGSPATEFPCINHGTDWFYSTDDILYNL